MKRIILSIFMFTLVLSALVNTLNIMQVSAELGEDMELTWYSSSSACYSALKNDEVDIATTSMGPRGLSYEQFEDAQADPNVQLASYDESGIFEFDINNNYSIMDYPNVRSPTNDLKVRQAIAHLINKSYIVEETLPKSWGETIDVPISKASSGWWNTSVTGVNYPYNYDPDVAAALLSSLGFNDTDGNGYLNYPSDWPGIENLPNTDTTKMPLKIYIREDHVDRKEAGNYLIHQLEGDTATPGDSPLADANWPLGFRGGDFDTEKGVWIMQDPVTYYRNYHIYTGAWDLDRFPPEYMYFLYHSSFWYPWGPNFVTDMEYSNLDLELEKAYYADDISTAMFRCKNAQGLLVDKYCVSVWLWNPKCFNAYRKELAGVVSQQDQGIVNQYTYLNAYRVDDPTASIRIGLPSAPDILNVLYSPWSYEQLMLDMIYANLMSVNPYHLTTDQPWVAQDWESSMWYDPRDGENKTVVTFWLRKDVGCAEPQTGNLVDYFTADDFEFSVWYNYAFDDSWMWDSVMDVHHIKIVNDYQVEVYFDDYSPWLGPYVGQDIPLLGPKDTLIDKLCEQAKATFVGSDLAEFSSGYFEHQFTTDHIVQVINATVNGIPIMEDLDFYVRAGYDCYCHNIFVNLTSFALDDNITIWYYRAIPDGAEGFYLGGNLGLDWTDTMYSYGLYYPVSIETAIGGKVQLNRNPHFFLHASVLGEIDWRWHWEGTTKPRSGNYELSIYDVVMCAVAYGTKGDGEYDSHFLPGADIDANDLCYIGILDLVTITNSYGITFGKPPD